MSRAVRRLVGTVVVTSVAVVGLVVPAGPAAATEGLTVGASSTYTVDDESGLVRARIDMELANVTPDQRESDGVYQYYFDAFTLPVPAGAENLGAVSGGTALSVSLSGTEDPGVAIARIGFPNLLYGQSRDITLTFDVPGEEPRSEDFTRVGPGFATFVAYGPGDAGDNTVRVVAPRAMTLTSTYDGFSSQPSDGETTTHEATGAPDEDGGLWALVSLRDTSVVSETTVDVGDLAFVLEAFPGDDRWAEFVSDAVSEGIPTLERLVGNEWPGGLQRIREDAGPSVQGYDGWFDPGGDEIVVGEQLDADLIFHELSHAWLSGDRFDERWVYEGLAQVVAERAVVATDRDRAERPSVSRGSDLAVPLNAWSGDAGARSGEVDQYAYPAAHRVMTDLLGDLDDDAFAAVVGAAVRGERAYDPDGVVDPGAGRTSWQDWLDLVETRGGVTTGPDTYARWVLTERQQELLEPRAREREAYAELDAADGAWLPPEGLRDAMTEWEFDRSRAVREAVADLAPQAMAVQDAAGTTGLGVPDAVRDFYEDAEYEDDYTALADTLPAAARTITAVGAARDVASADRDPFTTLGAGLLGVDASADEAVALLDAGEVDPARAVADDVLSRADWALPLGAAVVVLALLLLVGLGWCAVRALRRPRAGTGRDARSREDRGAVGPRDPLGSDERPEPATSSERPG
ncbi:hypothetical protein KC207_05135 [Phycicoccus sp. BSK3Z-2]|uniref:Uncharacterized protein n=1 Tax=Phycicoccus avicenniae TaxID=2828860 RepID=A0A941HZV8_9MICO|nr:hypothetical protein [Phycicoccus avicenniae]MBR7742671.1 hypothetical protein [Phycicoccus avicenniae]